MTVIIQTEVFLGHYSIDSRQIKNESVNFITAGLSQMGQVAFDCVHACVFVNGFMYSGLFTITSHHTLWKLNTEVIPCHLFLLLWLLLLYFGVNRWLQVSVWWLLIFFKSNHVSYRMEIGQEFQSGGLNPGITNEGTFISSWLLSLWKCGETLNAPKYSTAHGSPLSAHVQHNERDQLIIRNALKVRSVGRECII